MTNKEGTAPTGILLVAFGASLWGTDALFRSGLARGMPAATLVFLEHVILVALTLPVLVSRRHQLSRLRWKDWVAALLIGAGASALATVLFTSAFRYGDPTTPLLLQKIQPLVAVIGARLLLGERLMPRFAWFLAGGMAGAYLIAFSEPSKVSIVALTPALFALGAAALWGMGTVLGRRLSEKLTFGTLTALRFAIGLPAAGLLVLLVPDANAVGSVTAADMRAIVALALVPGLLALLAYYRGLRSTPASMATLAELAFPLTAATLNYFVFGTTLAPTQWVGAALLAGTITVMSLLSQRGREAVGVRLAPAVSEA